MKTLMNITTLAFALIVSASLEFPTSVQAVIPPPDGGYPNNNTAEGEDALFSLTSGVANTANGFNALFSNTVGDANTANGNQALFNNTAGDDNTATGFNSLFSNTNGSFNTATGAGALGSNTSGFYNTATGWVALSFNTTGNQNTADGDFSLFGNTTGSSNTANGDSALYNNSTGSTNTAAGARALFSNNGDNNTATGFSAMLLNATGINNTANGVSALSGNATGSSNTAIGFHALYAVKGDGNIALGANAGSRLIKGDNNIDIGNPGLREESNTIRIGTQGMQTKTLIAGISDAAIGGLEVRVNQNGRLGTVASSKRFKELIKPMDKASEGLLALRPVTFRYKANIDPEGIPQFGLVAEDVEAVNPDLVVTDKDGKPYSVRYDQVNAMLLNEFLKEHRTVQDLKSTVAAQQHQIEALTAGLQKVSAQLDLSKTSQRTVLIGP